MVSGQIMLGIGASCEAKAVPEKSVGKERYLVGQASKETARLKFAPALSTSTKHRISFPKRIQSRYLV